MNAEFQTTLSNLENKLNALVISLTTSPTAAGAPAAAVNLLDADDSLTSAVETLKEHQSNYTKILKLRAEAQSLEEKVKDIVRLVVQYDKDIRTACGDEDDDDDDDDDETDSDSESGLEGADHDMDGMDVVRSSSARRKEVDYKLLLDFARRISKYNHQAAADAAAGAQTGKKPDDKMEITGTNGNQDNQDAEPVAAVTKEATSWLDESANMTRQVYMLPYPMEDRIRLGLMGQIQLAAAEGRPGFDSEKEVERLIREAEGLGAADAVAPVQVGDEIHHAKEAAQAAAHAGSTAPATSAAVARAPVAAPLPPKPKATLDLDLYDPDEDDD